MLTFGSIGYIAEAFVWTYLGTFQLINLLSKGLSSFSINYSNFPLLYTFLIFFAIGISRMVTVFIFPTLLNICKHDFGLELNQLKICWYSGLIRGVISFGLSY